MSDAFAMGMGGISVVGGMGDLFTIDGRAFDATRVDTRVGTGTVEE